jgi:hypothetical protein
VGNGSINPDPIKVQAVQEFPLPITKKDLKSHLVLTGYFLRYIQNYADLSVNLTDLLKKIEPNKIKWDERTIESFKSLKDILLKAPVLITSDFSQSFIVQTDASQHVIYAVLSQESSDGDHPVAYHN